MSRMTFAMTMDLFAVLHGGYCTVSTFKLAQHDDQYYPTAIASIGLPVASAAVLATEAWVVLHDITGHRHRD